MSSGGNTIKLLEHPKASRYDSDASNRSEDHRVMATDFEVLKRKTVPKEDVMIEIYVLTCNTNGKLYVGQAVSHVLNHGKYRRYGTYGRFKSHISEALKNNKSKQCRYLNNSIRKHGSSAFSWQLLKVCDRKSADEEEYNAIVECESMAPSGYNLKLGGKQFQHTEESRVKVAEGVQRFSENIRTKKYADYTIAKDIDPETLIHPLRREGKQYGWYVLYSQVGQKRIKTDFGGTTRDMDDSYRRAVEFVVSLQCKDT